MERRQCYYIPVDQFDSEGYIPSMVTEGIPGHTPMAGNGPFAQPWHWGTSYKEARAICDGENLKIGITAEAANEIVLSSMFAPEPAGVLKPGDPVPPERTGGMTGFVVGECGHRVAASEWDAGFRKCERC
jgi:hypothetical protein